MNLVRVTARPYLDAVARPGARTEYVLNFSAIVEVDVSTGTTGDVMLRMSNRDTYYLTQAEWRRVLRSAGEKMPPPRPPAARARAKLFPKQ